MSYSGLMEKQGTRRRGWVTLMLGFIGFALLSIGAFYLAVGLQMPDPDPMREPRLMVTISDTPRDLASQLKEIPGVAGVLPAREHDLESMYLSADSGWHVGSTLVLLVEEGVELGLLRDQLMEVPGVHGYAERTDFGGTWRVGDESGGAWYDRRGLVVYLWPLLFAVPGIVLLWLAWKRRQASGGSVPVV